MKRSRQDSINELEFVKGVTVIEESAPYFTEYCKNLAAQCELDGYADIAEEIRKLLTRR